MTTPVLRVLYVIGAWLCTVAVPAVSLAQTGGTAPPGVSTKDIVIERLTDPAPPTGAPDMGDAMSVSVLLESPEGVLVPRSTAGKFRTGDRFRVRVLAGREGTVSLYNTNPLGKLKETPLWQGQVMPGQETISPRLRLVGNSGVDQLHVVLEPVQAGPQGVVGWLQGLLNRARDAITGKDFRPEVEQSPSYTYVLNRDGQGLEVTVRIAHD